MLRRWQIFQDGKKSSDGNQMAKNLQNDEKFCIFIAKDKWQAIILTVSYIEYLQALTAKAVSNFLFLIVIFKLF